MGIEVQLKKVKIPGPSALALSVCPLTFCETSFELVDLTPHWPTCRGNSINPSEC